MKTVRVVAALIIRDGKILATQRNYGEFEGGWEFPGGKIEPDETPAQALKREIEEELETEICNIEFLDNIKYQYDTFFLDMDCLTCSIESGELVLHDHSSKKWLPADELGTVDWLPADITIVDKLARALRSQG